MTKELITLEYQDEATGIICRYTQVYIPATDMGHWYGVVMTPQGDILYAVQSLEPWPRKITLTQCETRLTELLTYNGEAWQAQGWIRGGK